MMTGKEYRESLAKRRPLNVYLNGEKLEDPINHPIVAASVNSIALTYEMAEKPEYEELMTATSALTGKKVNRFTHLHQSTDDLIKKVKMQRMLGGKCGTCFQRCVGMDGLNATFITTHAIDKKYGTNYHERFKNYIIQAEENDWVIDGAMTDTKGDRSKRPADQPDPDAYVRVVERREDGIVVRGAKAHQTGAVNSHEVLIMPTIAMREEDKDYAVICSFPADDPNITYIYGRQSCDTRMLEKGSIDCGSRYGGQEALMILNDVFVPNENIYMDGEYDFTPMIVEHFAGYHRQSYACKTGVGDVAIGAAALVSEYNGAHKASHVKDKIVEMNHLNETLWCGSVACSASGDKTEAGNYYIDTLLANVAKQNVTRFPYEISRLLQDIAGGLMVTLPGEGDFNNPDIKDLLEKYLKANPDVSTENRQKLLRLIENLTMGRASVGYLTESMHGAGSPQAQRIMISRLANMEAKKDMAKDVANIED